MAFLFQLHKLCSVEQQDGHCKWWNGNDVQAVRTASLPAEIQTQICIRIPNHMTMEEADSPRTLVPNYCDVHAVGNIACVDNRCYGNG
jgi:hypothetical protein